MAAGTVTNLTETDFRAALQNGGDVTFANSGTITLTSTIVISSNTVVDATGRTVSISGNNAVRLFEVRSNASFTLQNLTLTSGRTAGTNGINGTNGAFRSGTGRDGSNGTAGESALGGGILNRGTLSLVSCSLTFHSAIGGTGGDGGDGGGSDFIGGDGGNGANGGAATGGAIYNLGSVFMFNCTVASNTVSGGHGGFRGFGGEAPFVGLDGDGGTGAQAVGAGIFNQGTLTVLSSTFSDNIVTGGDSRKVGPNSNNSFGHNGKAGGMALGGGIYSTGAVTMVNCTFAFNDVTGGNGGDGGDGDFEGGDGGDGGLGSGGGLYSLANATITNCTFGANSALGGTNGFAGGGPAFPGSPGDLGKSQGGNLARAGGSLVIANSIVASAVFGGNFFGTITDAGYNLSTDNSANLTGPGSLKNATLNLGAFGDYGGPTLTILPQIGSPALDRITNGVCIATDQRGITRPRGAYCDVGAVESTGLEITSQPQSQTVTNGATVMFTVTVNGESPQLFQWRFNGTNALGTNGPALTLTNVQLTNAGNYMVIVTNPVAVRTSAVAVLKVIAPVSLAAPLLIDGTNFSLTLSSATGLSYYLEFKNTLADSNWTRLRTNFGDGSFITNLIPTAGSTSRFFRVAVE